ncbi:hypothetical protein AAMO2058_001307600 [Amorphochlora amoebiformis]
MLKCSPIKPRDSVNIRGIGTLEISGISLNLHVSLGRMAGVFISIALVGLAIVFQISIHQVDEGYRGVYWTGGKLHESISMPGYHFKLPLTRFEQVQISLQTDRVTNIPCGTSGGVTVTFDAIEVMNQLSEDHVINIIREYGVEYDQLWIFDKIHHEINQFCSSHTLQEVYIDLFDTLDESLTNALQRDVDKYAPGLTIHSARVTKPVVPPGIMQNYERMELQRTQLLISTERQRVVEKQAETARLKATIEAEKLANVSRINMERKLVEKMTYQKIKQIDDSIYLAKEKAKADSKLYFASRRAEANSLKLTPQFLENTMYEVIRESPKTLFATSMSKVFESESTPSKGSGEDQ